MICGVQGTLALPGFRHLMNRNALFKWPTATISGGSGGLSGGDGGGGGDDCGLEDTTETAR